MAQQKSKRTTSHLVGHRDLLAKLRAEFPQSKINVSPLQRGECSLSVSGADASTVYLRAQMLACIAVLFNSAALFNRQLNKSRWTRFATLCDQSENHSQLRFRRGKETIGFYLEPVGSTTAGDSLSLYLREL
jgi:hypothetical protein